MTKIIAPRRPENAPKRTIIIRLPLHWTPVCRYLSLPHRFVRSQCTSVWHRDAVWPTQSAPPHMQRLGKQLLNLRLFQRPEILTQLAPCGRHTYSAAAQAGLAAPHTHSADGATEKTGIKALLTNIMFQSEAPLTSDDIWTEVAKAGGRSKTHTKAMLAQMKKAGLIGTKLVDTKRRRFGYYLKPEYVAKIDKRHAATTSIEEQL